MNTVALLFLSLLSFANPQLMDPRYELMKCTAPKHGTIWASFGHLMRSGEDQMIHFPTEIIWVPGLTATPQRNLYWTLEEALKVPISVGPNRLSMKFEIGGFTHHIRLIRYNNLAHSFLGSWQNSSNGQDFADEIACSLH